MQKKVETVEIDRIVDGLVKDHALADALKKKLHDHITPTPERYARTEMSRDASEDLWDNMPV